MDDNEQLDFDDSAIAIIGMACHLPGALNIDEFWENLKNGVESVRFYTDEELLAAGELPENLTNPNYVRAQPYLENYDRFDAGFWGFSPQDAAVTDPAHRIFLEVAYEAIEHSGHTAYDSEGTVGVFAGSGASMYWMDNLRSNPQLISDMGEFLVRHTGNDMNFLATRFSYEMDLRGPSINVQTACSSALVSVHMAIQSLNGGECDMALAGGSTVLLPQKRGYIYRDGEIMSPDGHCRPFDSQSAGTVFGSGAGAVVLKRLSDAVEDGDTVYAVIKGSAINNDGSQKVGFLAPGVEGQAGAIAEALSISETSAEEISYIETHGTGTRVGDPIEFEALNQVFREATDKRDFCAIGSVKSNIGHLGEAAGAASLIKVILSLQNQKIPSSINYTSPNPQLDLNDSPFRINDRLVDWKSTGPRIAGVTALGAGGTNAHLIVEEAPELESGEASAHSKQLVTLSAKTESALTLAIRNLSERLKQDTDLDLADVAYTLNVGRRDYKYRAAIACSDTKDLVAELDSQDTKRLIRECAAENQPRIAFMFPGGGAQYSGMGADLYEMEEVYRQSFDECIACLPKEFGEKVKALVFSEKEQRDKATVTLQTPTLTLTSLFATEYALAKLLESWGAKPACMIGHSMGENTAACLSGVFSLYDAMNLVYIRGQVFEKAPEGGMLSISLPLSEARQYMPDSLDVAAVNSPDLCVATGAMSELQTLQAILEKNSVESSIVRINVAAHSRMLDGVLEEFRAYVRSIKLSKPNIPFTSNLSGTWITDDQATNPDYWVDHLRNTVRFSDNISTILAEESNVLIEVGPGRTLSNLARANGAGSSASFNSMRHPNEDVCDLEFALRTVGRIWGNGAEVDWSRYWQDEFRLRVPLPTYPFERKAYWVNPGIVDKTSIVTVDDVDVPLKKRPNIEDWFGYLQWQQSEVLSAKLESKQNFIVFDDEQGLADKLVDDYLCHEAINIMRVKVGENFASLGANCYQVCPNDFQSFESLIEALDLSSAPSQFVYCWSYDAQNFEGTLNERLKVGEDRCFWGLFNLSKVLGEIEDQVTVSVIANGLYPIAGAPVRPEKALLLGPVNILPHEFSHVDSRAIDVVDGIEKKQGLLTRLVNELLSVVTERCVAYKGQQRWVRNIVNAPMDSTTGNTPWLRENATVLISGGLGGIGLQIAHSLSTLGAKNLILSGRSSLAARETWNDILSKKIPVSEAEFEKISALRSIEETGCRVHLVVADVSDLSAMELALQKLGEVAEDIHGVVHAAGLMDDQIAVLKSETSVKDVLSGKAHGAAVLDQLFLDRDLDFFVLFSSVASYLGLPGQIDYTAANAFLDALAFDRAERSIGITKVINWNAWADVGMTVDVVRKNGGGTRTSQSLSSFMGNDVSHPALDSCEKIDGSRLLFRTEFSVAKHWLLSEHVTQSGSALIPGTGYIELMRAAVADFLGEPGKTGLLSLNDVQFLSAFQVDSSQVKSLNLMLEKMGEEFSLSIYSDSDELPHATATAHYSSSPAAIKTLNLDEILARCSELVPTKGRFMDQVFMDFGPRWACIDAINKGKKEALLSLSLAEPYVSDIGEYGIHPALLDMATGSAQFLMEGFSKTTDFFVPISYGQALILNDMPARIVSHIILVEEQSEGFVSFDIRMADKLGEVFMEVKNFTMKRVDPSFLTEQLSASEEQSVSGSEVLSHLEAVLREAILPKEGVSAFERIMSNNTGQVQWIVSSVDSALWYRNLDLEGRSAQDASVGINFEQELEHDADSDPDIAQIEDIIQANDGVESVVVRSFLDENSRRRLIAYYIPDGWGQITITELRKFVRDALPEDMLPQQLLELDEFPTDGQGNIDRTQLLDPFAPIDNYIPPETQTQDKLAKIWKSVVGVNRVSLNENFFDIGGHSLLSIRVIVKVKKEFGVRLDQSIMVLLTLEQMAQEIDDQMSKINSSQVKHASETDLESHGSSASEIEGESKKYNANKRLFKSLFKKRN